MRTERPVKRTRVYEGMAAAFASDGVMWTAMGREEPAGVHMPRVTVMGRNGRRRTCHNVTIDEALCGRAGGGEAGAAADGLLARATVYTLYDLIAALSSFNSP
jgi:hypothetical protein